MELRISPTGLIRAVYGEAIPLDTLGALAITRASSVEPGADGQWHVDLASVGGPTLGPFGRRTEALRAESDWLCGHWLLA